jgi:hypothetical protein
MVLQGLTSFSEWEPYVLGLDVDVLGFCLIKLDRDNVFHSFLDVEGRDLFGEFSSLELGISEDVFDVHQQKIRGRGHGSYTFVHFF